MRRNCGDGNLNMHLDVEAEDSVDVHSYDHPIFSRVWRYGVCVRNSLGEMVSDLHQFKVTKFLFTDVTTVPSNLESARPKHTQQRGML